ncbi:MAG: pimeloyl-ACP methyl ester carboxylesterase [Cognaticolwellia sp.]|jgi:pimeloyl-ACP methyl ester carboxylesterase
MPEQTGSELHSISIGDGPKLALVLHGILGSGRNWMSFAKSMVQACPEWRFELMDLRAHGRSPTFTPPHTVGACAGDLKRFVTALKVQAGQDAHPSAIIGHSFGGKVALSYGRDFSEGLEQVWVLDSPPSNQASDVDDSEVVQVIRALRSIRLPLAKRDELIPLLAAHGLSKSLALWMTTNLKREGKGLVWRFDLDAVAELIGDYFEQDFWPLLQRPPSGPTWHILQADRSERWRPEDAQRIAQLPAWNPVHHHTLADSGHWVHVDNPKGLEALMLPWLSGERS